MTYYSLAFDKIFTGLPRWRCCVHLKHFSESLPLLVILGGRYGSSRVRQLNIQFLESELARDSRLKSVEICGHVQRCLVVVLRRLFL